MQDGPGSAGTPGRIEGLKPERPGRPPGSGFDRLLAGGVGLALGDPGGLPAALAQIVELGTADGAAALHLDGFDHRGDQREQPLHALAERDLPHGEALVDALTGAGDAHALVGLDALALA